MSRTTRISAREAWRRLGRQRLRLIDIRRRHETLTGMAEGADHVERDALAADPDRFASDSALALICARGMRSADLADTLADRLDCDVLSVEGGMEAWREAELPTRTPDSSLTAREAERYQRHLALPGIGEAGQMALKQSRVLVVGAGGLGSPASLYLAAAGVGRIRIVDDDRVERSNLQRQVLHGEAGLGRAKAGSARQRLIDLNPDVEIEAVEARVDSANVDELVSGCDAVIDGSDNFPTRYRLNDACLRAGVPVVFGAVERFVGMIGIVEAGQGGCYRCLFPEPPRREDAPGCAEAGVFGVLPGVIGTLQATETLKLLLDIGRPLTGRLLRYDALEGRFLQSNLARDPDCGWCGPGASPPAEFDYEAFCAD